MTTSVRIGVLGLGRMGLPITRALVAGGYEVTVFDPAHDRFSEAVSAGTFAGSDEQDVAARSEVLLTVLPGSPELLEAMEGSGGAIDALPAGSCWIDLTSNDPEVAARLAARASGRGVDVVGAPMMGGPDDAESKQLRFYLGGADDAIERALPVLRLLGAADDGIRTGPTVESAHLTKLLANGLWFGQVVAVTEAMLLGKASGLDPAVLASALARGPGGSVFIDRHLGALLEGDYLPAFGLSRVVDELAIVSRLAAESGTPYRLGDVVRLLHEEALERFGPVDGELLAAKLLEQRAGATVSWTTSLEPTRAGADPAR